MIFCVEDDENIRELVVYTLVTTGFDAKGFADGAAFMEALALDTPELILLDIMLPGEDGMEILRKLKKADKTKNIPVIMVTAKGTEYDKVIGLDTGADDYVTKPFNPVELQARVKSQIRRYMLLGAGNTSVGKLVIGGIELDDKSKTVTVDGEAANLTRTEYDILKLLMEHPGEVYSPNQIYAKVWKDEPYGTENTVAVHIRHLREKVEINPAEPRYLKVIWGRGYKIDAE